MIVEDAQRRSSRGRAARPDTGEHLDGAARCTANRVCATEDTRVTRHRTTEKFKAEAEGIVAAAEIPKITLRLANVYGARQRQDLEGGVIAIFLGRWKKGEKLTLFGDGAAQRDYIYVGDVVDAVLSSFAGEWKGIYNIGTGVPTSVNDLIAALTEILGPPPGSRRRPSVREVQRSCIDSSKAGAMASGSREYLAGEGLRLTAESA